MTISRLILNPLGLGMVPLRQPNRLFDKMVNAECNGNQNRCITESIVDNNRLICHKWAVTSNPRHDAGIIESNVPRANGISIEDVVGQIGGKLLGHRTADKQLHAARLMQKTNAARERRVPQSVVVDVQPKELAV